MIVRKIMTIQPETVRPEDSIESARLRMERGGFRSLPVVDDSGRLVGIITSRDVLRYAHALPSTKVDHAMTRDPITIAPDTSAEECATTLLAHKFGGLPVVEEGRVIGIVTSTDLLRAFVRVERATRRILDP
jgi:acetoin utilization protein AcuB